MQAKQVLLIEKDRIQQKVIANLLSVVGHDAVILNGDRDRLHGIIAHERIDVVLADWDLLSDGEQALLHDLKGLGVSSRIPLVTMLPERPSNEVDNAREVGLEHFVKRPFGSEALDEAIRTVLPDSNDETPEPSQEPLRNTDYPKSMQEFLRSKAPLPQKRSADQMARSLFLEGKAALEAKSYARAASQFTAAIKVRPLFPDAFKGLAMAAQGARDMNRFRQYLLKTVEAHLRLRQLDKASAFFQVIRRHYPAAPNIFKIYGDALLRSGKVEDAVAVYQTAETLFPADPDVPLALAMIYQQSGRNEEAVEHVTRVLEQDAADPRAGEMYMTLTGRQWRNASIDDIMDEADEDVEVVGFDSLDQPSVQDGAVFEEAEVVEIAMLEDTYSGPVRTLANPTLLIVDDEPHIRMLLEEALEELEDEGVRILMAEDGAQGLETISREKPDLVFLDVMMPKMNGFDVCTAVKKQLALDNVFIVMLTAKGQEFDKVKGRESGTDIYMTKPFSPMDVLSLARKILGLN
ncbi:response regulator [Oceanidesulfovibrio marinus]|uniref:Response regulator n=1 Tax=Oceanidesulfovibrio marinus TaxID=370038 RepID=A0ABX6ND95_9BACT|nr:response regulator [Oceanidesulfovibrio marinus]